MPTDTHGCVGYPIPWSDVTSSNADDGSRTLMVASIRYLNAFVKQDGAWLFAERRLMVNWIDTRPSVS